MVGLALAGCSAQTTTSADSHSASPGSGQVNRSLQPDTVFRINQDRALDSEGNPIFCTTEDPQKTIVTMEDGKTVPFSIDDKQYADTSLILEYKGSPTDTSFIIGSYESILDCILPSPNGITQDEKKLEQDVNNRHPTRRFIAEQYTTNSSTPTN